MPKFTNYPRPLRLNISVELDNELNALAKKEQKKKTDIIRMLLSKAVSEEFGRDRIEILDDIKKTIAQELKPLEEKIAKLSDKLEEK